MGIYKYTLLKKNRHKFSLKIPIDYTYTFNKPNLKLNEFSQSYFDYYRIDSLYSGLARYLHPVCLIIPLSMLYLLLF